MSSLARTIRRRAQRERLNTVARRGCPDCGSVLKANSATSFTCMKFQKRFKPKPKPKKA